MRKFSKVTLGAATAALLVAGVVGVSTTATASAPAAVKGAASSVPAPAAAVPALKGGNTAVALDSGFLAALKSLKLTPCT